MNVKIIQQVVAPKKAKLQEAETTLSATMALLNSKREELTEIEDKVRALKLQFEEMTEKKAQLEFQVCYFVFLESATSYIEVLQQLS